MSVDSLTFGEEYFYLHDTLYRQTIKECLCELGKKILRPGKYTTETFSGMDGYLNMTGKLRHRRRYEE
ncbi:MAG: hypothetical protein WC404_00165 [Candidatus Omnitrophota bacterium]